ncbi:DUF3301 domain-containing protein [Sedimenticola sp.]|uniref:DUF3301 domain-containing protein n=1 Tax=Sedimenticola sp. TaxID=1940285 RepID=UPI003D0C116A
MSTLVPLLLLGLLIWFWLDSARAREIATGICQAACEQRNLQFLDQTVALRRISLRWTQRGIRIRRLFQFDYSEEGVGRRDGHVILVGIQLEEFSLGLPSQDDKVVPFRPKPPDL